MIIDKFGTIVGVEAEKGEGERLTKGLEAGEDMFLGFVEDGSALSPTCCDIGEGEGAEEIAVGRATVMSDKIGLDEALERHHPSQRRCGEGFVF